MSTQNLNHQNMNHHLTTFEYQSVYLSINVHHTPLHPDHNISVFQKYILYKVYKYFYQLKPNDYNLQKDWQIDLLPI